MAEKKSFFRQVMSFVGFDMKEDNGFQEDVRVPSYASNRKHTTYNPDDEQEQRPRERGERSGGSSRFDSSSERRHSLTPQPGQRASSRFGDSDDYDDEIEERIARRREEDRYDRSSDPRTLGRSASPRRNAERESGRRSNAAPETSVRAGESDLRNPEIIVAYVAIIDDLKPLINALIRGYTILLTLDTGDSVMRQRIVDMMYGAAFALGASFSKASHSNLTFVVTPRGTNLVKYKDFNG